MVMNTIRDGVDFFSTGWRVLLGIILATVWITAFLYEIKAEVQNLSGKVDGYHSMVQIISNQNDKIEGILVEHIGKGGHDVMESRMKSVEKKLDNHN